jgi:hypothetical protein
MNRAVMKISLAVIAQHFFDDKVKILSANVSHNDMRDGSITLLIEGEDLPEPGPEGSLYPEVSAIVTEHWDETNLVPARATTIKFKKVS